MSQKTGVGQSQCTFLYGEMSDMQDCCPIDIKSVKVKAVLGHAVKAYIYGERYSFTLLASTLAADVWSTSCLHCFTPPEKNELNRRKGMPHGQSVFWRRAKSLATADLTSVYLCVCVCVYIYIYIYIITSTTTNISVDMKNQLDITFCILYFSSNSCATCFGQPCAHHQELTTA